MGSIEERNSELVEAVKAVKETTRKNVMKIAEVEKALIEGKAVSIRLMTSN